MILAVTARVYLTQVGIKRCVIPAAESQRLIYQMWSPVKQLTAAVFSQGLPVIPRFKRVPAYDDLEDVSNNFGICYPAYLIKQSLKAAVMPYIQLHALLLGYSDKLLCLPVVHRHRLLEQNVPAVLKSFLCVSVMVARAHGYIENIDILV